MRTHISKSLQTRCKAIKKAVEDYNSAASEIGRPAVDWSRVSHYGFLEEFNLLQDTKNNVRSRPWAQPMMRNLLKAHSRIARAEEELIRCTVEIRRLHTSIRDERTLFQETLSKLAGTPLYSAVKDFVERRQNVHDVLLDCVFKIYDLPGFGGIKGPGVRVGTAPNSSIPVPVPRPLRRLDGDSSNDGELDGEGIEGDIGGMVQFVSHLV